MVSVYLKDRFRGFTQAKQKVRRDSHKFKAACSKKVWHVKGWFHSVKAPRLIDSDQVDQTIGSTNTRCLAPSHASALKRTRASKHTSKRTHPPTHPPTQTRMHAPGQPTPQHNATYNKMQHNTTPHHTTQHTQNMHPHNTQHPILSNALPYPPLPSHPTPSPPIRTSHITCHTSHSHTSHTHMRAHHSHSH